ncbi:Alpha/Beta hydrolase protein [Syncephalis plumigaleata]|nr:Alpha/Beta hydrolase protein [Syncephalis plumigaleata]
MARSRLMAKLKQATTTSPRNDGNSVFRLKRVYQQDYNEISALSDRYYKGRVLYRDLSAAEQRLTRPHHVQDIYTTEEYQYAAGDESGPFVWPKTSRTTSSSAHLSDFPPTTVLALSRMSMYAYWQPAVKDIIFSNDDDDDDDDDDGDKEEWKDLDGWRRHQSYGWTGNGLRAHVFEASDESLLVISFKGTSVPFMGGRTKGDQSTGGQDKRNDNLMFACCCGRRGLIARPYCDCQRGRQQCDGQCAADSTHFHGSYYDTAMDMYTHIREAHPEHRILVVGHSLGGSIASLVATTLATNNQLNKSSNDNDTVIALAFEAPGEALFANRLGLLDTPLNGEKIDKSQLPVWHFGIMPILSLWGHGKRCLFDTANGLGWLPAVKYHRAPTVIKYIFEPWARSNTDNNDKENDDDGDDIPFSIPVDCGVDERSALILTLTSISTPVFWVPCRLGDSAAVDDTTWLICNLLFGSLDVLVLLVLNDWKQRHLDEGVLEHRFHYEGSW